MTGEMKVSDVRNWVLNNMFNNGNPSQHDICFAGMLEKNYSVWISTWEVEKLFMTFFEDGAWGFRAMECDVITYYKD